ncbi:MAG: DUF3341 domain-containing protein [Rubricoccaceae bacterium]|nr:DUF3341 domain-containing protein [Rubricoccaceae bacterium]
MLSFLRKQLEVRANQHVGLLAEFSDPGALLHAVERLRARGYRRLDTFSPFPIHGMDRAMGLGPSKLGFIVFGMGLIGAAAAVLLQWWTSAVDYPIAISNKPLFAWEPSIPIIFELTVLFSALGAIGGMLALNALPKPYNPLFHSERFGRATDDGFFLHIAAADAEFDRAATARALFEEGAQGVEYVDHDGAEALAQAGAPGDGAPAADAPPARAPAEAPATPPHTTGEI